SSMTQLRQFVHGITLLGMCPDNVNARIISKGERVSIQLMKAVMEAKGLPANLVVTGRKCSVTEAIRDVTPSFRL
ncbi:hypothetical protein, partial [Vibrio cholerae]|uniref:hypothetical protein n=1 Tax=Vibrio cholerae TaxID=666 RepID=UPI001124F309